MTPAAGSAPRCVLVTGAIGSGKTTVASTLVGRLALPYVSPDLYFHLLFRCDCCSAEQRYERARNLCRHRLDGFLEAGRSFLWETVVASDWKWDFLSRCRRTHLLTIVYVSVSPPDVCVERAERRAEAGWYRVSSQKVLASHVSMSRDRDRLAAVAERFISIENSTDRVIGPTRALEGALINV
ncbi:AAA family ATPase [Micromonospora sp. NPDC018662]|uniref:AAA family ATPase n=1 Tax=Micromonospora sp. NPDC018662 TaxID=3364238 RepID=UPI0037A5E068